LSHSFVAHTCWIDGLQGSVPDSQSEAVSDDHHNCQFQEDPDSSTASDVELALSDGSKKAKNQLLKQLLLHPDCVDMTSITTVDTAAVHVTVSSSVTSDNCLVADNADSVVRNARPVCGNYSDDLFCDLPSMDDKLLLEQLEHVIMDPELSMEDLERLMPSDSLFIPPCNNLDLPKDTKLPPSDEHSITSKVQSSSRGRGWCIVVLA
jgi:hypothetical protein